MGKSAVRAQFPHRNTPYKCHTHEMRMKHARWNFCAPPLLLAAPPKIYKTACLMAPPQSHPVMLPNPRPQNTYSNR
jgi:hypothetical protein